MQTTNPINRLTTREKEVLRAWLDHKSAKEIAIDLGITHHAVEKRLKMARTKLGAASSREAAQMLARHEGYQPTVTASPDLSPAPPSGPSRRYRPIIAGGIAMSLAVVVALALAPAIAPVPDPEPDNAAAEVAVEGRIDRVFEYLDKDESGFLESPESPFVAVAFLDDSGAEPMSGEAVIGNSDNPDHVAEFYGTADTDGDGRISLDEYAVWSEAHWKELGIEIRMIMKVLPAPES